LRARFGERKHELVVNSSQTCILYIFNDYDRLDYGRIKELVGVNIPDVDLRRELQSLACGKYRILEKNPKGKEVNPTDEFIVNDSFTSKLIRIKIPTILKQKENDIEKKYTRAKIDDDRKPQIDAVIVRIMKSRKELDHVNLLSETTAQLSSRFAPDPMDIKLRIESLIERDFLERSDLNSKVYRYIA